MSGTFNCGDGVLFKDGFFRGMCVTTALYFWPHGEEDPLAGPEEIVAIGFQFFP